MIDFNKFPDRNNLFNANDCLPKFDLPAFPEVHSPIPDLLENQNNQLNQLKELNDKFNIQLSDVTKTIEVIDEKHNISEQKAKKTTNKQFGWSLFVGVWGVLVGLGGFIVALIAFLC